MQPPKKQGYYCVGVITGAHGVHGGVRIKPFTEYAEDLTSYGTLVDFKDRAYELKNPRVTPKGVLARIDAANDRNAAEALRGTCLYVPEDALPELDEDEAYLGELVGMQVIKEDGAKLGTIKDIFDTQANVVVVVQPLEGKEILLPFTEDVVVKVDHQNRTLFVTEFAQQFVDL